MICCECDRLMRHPQLSKHFVHPIPPLFPMRGRLSCIFSCTVFDDRTESMFLCDVKVIFLWKLRREENVIDDVRGPLGMSPGFLCIVHSIDLSTHVRISYQRQERNEFRVPSNLRRGMVASPLKPGVQTYRRCIALAAFDGTRQDRHIGCNRDLRKPWPTWSCRVHNDRSCTWRIWAREVSKNIPLAAYSGLSRNESSVAIEPVYERLAFCHILAANSFNKERNGL